MTASKPEYCIFGSDRHTVLDATQTPHQIRDLVTHEAYRSGMDKPNGVCEFHAKYLLGLNVGWKVTPLDSAA